MSCYFRHLKFVLDEAGIEITPENKRQVDKAIHSIIGTDYKDCSATWRKIKNEILTDPGKRRDFIRDLKARIETEPA